MANEGKKIRLKSSLFGFNKNDVNKYISNLEKQKNTELNELKESITVITTENKMWERELQELKDVLNKQLRQQNFMQYALDKAETQIRPLLIRTAENEVEKISIVKAKKELDYNLNTNDFNENSEEDLCNLKDDFSSCLEMNNNISREILLEDISEDIEDKKKPENSTLNIDILEEHNLEKESNKVELDYSNTDIFEGKQGSENKESEFIYDNIENIKKFQAETINDTSDMLIEKDNEISNNGQENKNKIAIENKPIESKAVTSEIKNIRSKYLIGKIVGEDLMDGQGKLLTKKGSIITENLVEIVDKEGKLAELILNMVLPEASE